MVSTGKRPLEDNLILDYKFNEGAGLVVHDYSPSRLHGALVNTPDWITDTPDGGPAINIDVNNEVLQTQSTSIFNLQTEDFTIAFLVRVNDSVSGYVKLLEYGGYSTGGLYMDLTAGIGVYSAGLYFGNVAGGARNVVTGLTYTQSVWHVLGFIVDRTNDVAYSYRDGEIITTDETIPNYDSVASDVMDIIDANNRLDMCWMKVWTEALSDEDMRLLSAQRRRI